MILKTLFLILMVTNSECARILGIFSMCSTSHNILAFKLMKGLADAGHNVTMVSPYPLKDYPKNGSYTDIILDGFSEDFQAMLKKGELMKKKDEKGVTGQFREMIDILLAQVNTTLDHPKLKQLVKSNEKFDVLLMEHFLSDGLFVYGHHFDCPVVLLNSEGATPSSSSIVGNPMPVSYVPSSGILPGELVNNPSSLISRAKNLAVALEDYYLRTFYIKPAYEAMIHEKYPNVPSLDELNDRVALILLNTHFSMSHAQPLVPNMIEIGGYFIDPPKKLPKDLQQYMDNATDGVIYFSLGSNAKSADMSPEKKQIFLNIFRKLKQKVIWKFEEDLANTPSNVLIRKWCPQQDILAHPNLKLFITHGGLLSTTETIYHGVPILAIPIFSDQPANAARAVAGGYALQLSYHDPEFTEEKLQHLINELLNNPQYKENVKQRSRLFHDRPMTPMETAVYWVEYVIKHKGAPHLKVAGAKLPWYKYFMIDVIGLIIVVVTIVAFLTVRLVKTAFRKITINQSKVKVS